MCNRNEKPLRKLDACDEWADRVFGLPALRRRQLENGGTREQQARAKFAALFRKNVAVMA